MAQDSRRKRYLRRVKRERTQLRQAVAHQQTQMQEMVGMLVKQQTELKELRPEPSFTIKTLPDDPDNFFPADVDEDRTLIHGSAAAVSIVPNVYEEATDDSAIPVDSNPS